MPRKVKINEHPNPTNLTMQERRIAVAVIQSLRTSVALERPKQQSRKFYRHDWDVDDEKELINRVYRAALNQLTGRQKTEEGIFTLHYDADVRDEDMEYVRQSLGMVGNGS